LLNLTLKCLFRAVFVLVRFSHTQGRSHQVKGSGRMGLISSDVSREKVAGTLKEGAYRVGTTDQALKEWNDCHGADLSGCMS